MIGSAELGVCLLVPPVTCGLSHAMGGALSRDRPGISVGLAGIVGCLALTAYTQSVAARSTGQEAIWWLGLQDAWTSMVSPRVAREWFPGIIAVAMAATLLLERGPSWMPWLVGGAVAGIPWRLLSNSVYMTQTWGLLDVALRLGGGALAGVVVLTISRPPDSVETLPADRCRWLSATGVFAGLSVVLITSGSLVYGKLGLICTAAVALPALLSWRGGWPMTPAMPVLLACFTTLMVLGVYYAEVTRLNAVLMIGGFMLAVSARPSSQRGQVLRLVVTLTLVAVAVGLAVLAFLAALEEAANNPYSAYK